MDAVGIIPGQIVTEHLRVVPRVVEGYAQADPARDILKLACIERHRATGNVGVGLVVGLGLREGAIASSVAHDAHNIIVAGTNDDDMTRAVRAVEAMDGGLALVLNGAVRGQMPLPVAGLLSDQPAASVARALGHLSRQVQALAPPRALRDALLPRPLGHPGRPRHRSRVRRALIWLVAAGFHQFVSVHLCRQCAAAESLSVAVGARGDPASRPSG
jgi:hypothetical protein